MSTFKISHTIPYFCSRLKGTLRALAVLTAARVPTLRLPHSPRWFLPSSAFWATKIGCEAPVPDYKSVRLAPDTLPWEAPFPGSSPRTRFVRPRASHLRAGGGSVHCPLPRCAAVGVPAATSRSRSPILSPTAFPPKREKKTTGKVLAHHLLMKNKYAPPRSQKMQRENCIRNILENCIRNIL